MKEIRPAGRIDTLTVRNYVCVTNMCENKKEHKKTQMLICIVLSAAILMTFWPVRNYEFLIYDDQLYVTDNADVKSGLTAESALWAFTNTEAGFYHPLTWLSLMLDYQLYRLNAGGYHGTNLLLHILNTLLLFLLLNRMTAAPWKSGFVSALFALHPLHVESVAWISQRKDLLSTFFWILTMWSYTEYTKRTGAVRYAITTFFFILGLLSKAMLVTLPFVLLLVDYWPLKRFPVSQSHHYPATLEAQTGASLQGQITVLQLILEKVPLLVLAILCGVATYWAEKGIGALTFMSYVPWDARVANALVSSVMYIVKTIWPDHLSVFYPHPAYWPLGYVLLSGAFLLSVSFWVLIKSRSQPYLAVGWLWYLGTLLPVIGIVQVGGHAMADRYTYITLIGLFIMATWGIPDLIKRWRYRKSVLAVSSAVILVVLIAVTAVQLRYWKDTESLFKHALAVTRDNHVAYNILGNDLLAHGRLKEAANHYIKALQIEPDYVEAYNNLGLVFLRQGRLDKAIAHFYEAIRINPEAPQPRMNLGFTLMKRGRSDEAVEQYEEYLRLKPKDAAVHNNLGLLLANSGRHEDAMRHYNEAVRLKAGYAEAYNNLGIELAKLGKFDDAVYYFKEAIRSNHEFAEAHNNLGSALAIQGKNREAMYHYEEALRLKPDYLQAEKNLNSAREKAGLH